MGARALGKNTAAGCLTVDELDKAIEVLEATKADGRQNAATKAMAHDVELQKGDGGAPRFHQAQEPVELPEPQPFVEAKMSQVLK